MADAYMQKWFMYERGIPFACNNFPTSQQITPKRFLEKRKDDCVDKNHTTVTHKGAARGG